MKPMTAEDFYGEFKSALRYLGGWENMKDVKISAEIRKKSVTFWFDDGQRSIGFDIPKEGKK